MEQKYKAFVRRYRRVFRPFGVRRVLESPMCRTLYAMADDLVREDEVEITAMRNIMLALTEHDYGMLDARDEHYNDPRSRLRLLEIPGADKERQEAWIAALNLLQMNNWQRKGVNVPPKLFSQARAAAAVLAVAGTSVLTDVSVNGWWG